MTYQYRMLRLALIGGLLAAVTVGTPEAHADLTLSEQKFIQDMHARGFTDRNGGQDLLKTGYHACQLLGGGVVKGVVVNTIADEFPPNDANRDQDAQYLVNGAWIDLCPTLNMPG